MLRLLLAAAHLLGLGIGLGSVWARGQALRTASQSELTAVSLRTALAADNWWGVAAILWLGTGLWRAIAGVEKAPAYYVHNVLFWTKMGLFAALLLLESWPMVTLIRWRVALRRTGRPPGEMRSAQRIARRIGRISEAEAMLVVLIVLAAVSMARGHGATG